MGRPSNSSTKSAVSGDPRLPQAAKKYIPPEIKPEDLPLDVSTLLAIVFGVLGVMLKQRMASWVSLVCSARALANMQNPEHESKQIVAALTFAVMGLVTNYVALMKSVQTT